MIGLHKVDHLKLPHLIKKRNEPSYVIQTAQFLADFYGVSFETLAEHTTRNFLGLFKISSFPQMDADKHG